MLDIFTAFLVGPSANPLTVTGALLSIAAAILLVRKLLRRSTP